MVSKDMRPMVCAAVVIAAIMVGCGNDNHGGTRPSGENPKSEDTTPPARVTDLRVLSMGAHGADSSSVVLTWTATGDDGSTGQAARYDLRYAPGDSTSAHFAAMTPLVVLAPRAAGAAESVIVGHLSAGMTYTFALRVADEVPNWSLVSRFVQARLPDPPVIVPECAVTPTTLSFGVVPVGTATEQAFIIANRGGGILSGSISPTPCPSFTVVSASGNFSLSGGESLSVTVRFAPASADSFTCLLQPGPALCAGVLCQGRGSAVEPPPSCEIQPATLSFDSVLVGAQSERSITIRNTGGGTLAGKLIGGCPDFHIVSGGEVFALAAGETRQVAIRFAPTAAGSSACSFTTGLAECSEVPATGIGYEASPPQCRITPEALEFDTLLVGATRDRSFVLQNAGGGTLSGTIAAWCGHFSTMAGAGPFALRAGESVTVTVRFEPSAGDWSCDLPLETSGCPSIRCHGVCVRPPDPPWCSLSYGSLIFPDTPVGSASVDTFAISNGGGGTLSGSVAAGCGSYTVISGSGSFELAARESREVLVRFAPVSAGNDTCSFSLGTACTRMRCEGTGMDTTSYCTIVPRSIEAVYCRTGSSWTSTLSIINDGAGRLSGMVGPSCRGFTVTGDLSYSLASGERKDFTVVFAPEEPGTYECTLPLGDLRCASLPCRGTAEGSASMTTVPAGFFTMGSEPGVGNVDETPTHGPHIRAFSIDITEITNESYAAALNWANSQGLVSVSGSIVRTTGSAPQYLIYLADTYDELNRCRIQWDGSEYIAEGDFERHPVVCLTWYGAAAYCNWRSLMQGLTPCYDASTWDCNFVANGYRLPTEAEWEEAASGSEDNRTYPWGEGIDCRHANFKVWATAYCASTTMEVDADWCDAGISPYGLKMMSGNVSEWCQDWYGADSYAASPLHDPAGPSTGTRRVQRGGSWYDPAQAVRCSARSSAEPIYRAFDVGFRCVRR